MKKQYNIFVVRDSIRLLSIFLTLPWTIWIIEHIFVGGSLLNVSVFVPVIFGTFFIFGSLWCGWLCPFGNVSYFVSKIGKKIFPRFQYKIPDKIGLRVGYLRYVYAAIFIYAMVAGVDSIGKGEAMSFVGAYLFLKKIAVIIVPLFIARFFCRYMCFYKGLFNIINKISPTVAIVRNKTICTDCSKCTRTCPMGLEVDSLDKIVGSDCILCFNCLTGESGCIPESGILVLQFFGKKVHIGYFALFGVLCYVVAVFLYIMYMK
ncbi:MAG: 4Fe-4S binding protein [Desulfovibrionaceae bacterium]